MATYSRANNRSVSPSRRRPRNFGAQGQVTAGGMGNYSFNPPAGMSGRQAVAAGGNSGYSRAGRGNAPMGPGQQRVKRMQTQLARLQGFRTMGKAPIQPDQLNRLVALRDRLGRPDRDWYGKAPRNFQARSYSQAQGNTPAAGVDPRFTQVPPRGRKQFRGNFNAQADLKRKRFSRFRPPLS